jgi:hypothetical protein
MYRIAWRVIATNYSGHGDFCLSYPTAQEWLTRLHKEHPDMIHWIEEDTIKQT